MKDVSVPLGDVPVGNAVSIPFNQNHKFETTKIVASDINETNELAGSKSLFIPLKLGSTNANLSPVIDLDRASLICVANRVIQQLITIL